jgi:hypothetical protein
MRVIPKKKIGQGVMKLIEIKMKTRFSDPERSYATQHEVSDERGVKAAE